MMKTAPRKAAPESEEKARKRAEALAIKRRYDAQEQRRNRILWGVFYAVVALIVAVLFYNFALPAPGDSVWTMPFIEQRHDLRESNKSGGG